MNLCTTPPVIAARSEVAAIHTPHGSCDFAQDDKQWLQSYAEGP